MVGAGPSGLLLSLLLSRHGIPVHILEASHELDQQPRAAIYGPPAIPELTRAGVMEEIDRRGMRTDTFFWRRFEDYSVIAGFDGSVLVDVDGQDVRTSCLAMQELDEIMLDLVVNKHGGAISWRHRVVAVGQDADKAWADVETPDGPKRFEADYVIGCDGATSTVRKSLFGSEYPGWTWDTQIIATNVSGEGGGGGGRRPGRGKEERQGQALTPAGQTYYDLAGKFGFSDANFIVHPEALLCRFPRRCCRRSLAESGGTDHRQMAARITPDGLYRITYGEPPGLTREEYGKRLAWKFETMLPGHPKPGEYEVVSWSPYKMHQRCAPSFREGRVLLCADAAHVCNPWGGLGITGGFVDVGGLFDCLAGLWDGRADESILGLYSEKRIEKWKTIIDPISQENFRRVSDGDPATRLERDEWLRLLNSVAGDPDATKKVLLDFMGVRYDFTQHYTK